MIKTVMVCVHAPLRHASTCTRFTGLVYTTQGYTTGWHVALPPMVEVLGVKLSS